MCFLPQCAFCAAASAPVHLQCCVVLTAQIWRACPAKLHAMPHWDLF
jgi:hypothetical protein